MSRLSLATTPATAKLIVVVGTRPEAVKLAPVIHELRAHPGRLDTRVCATAQHREMLDQTLEIFAIRPDFDLDLMSPGQTLGEFAARGLAGLDALFRQQTPDAVVVQGDTTTSTMAALAAFYNGSRVAHVEAGLRSFDKHAPFPEEINRSLTSRLADLHFAPTMTARENLLREGVPAERIHVTGNTVVDAVQHVACRLTRGELHPALARTLSPPPEPFVLVTAHRRESHGEKIREIFGAIRDLSQALPHFAFVFPVHPNPQVLAPAREILGGTRNVRLIEPTDYVSFIWLMQRSSLILSDSGGVQEEAPSLGKRVLVMRDTTERPEGVEAGFLRLVGTGREEIVSAVLETLRDGHANLPQGDNPYGDGRAARRIAGVLKSVPMPQRAVRFEPLGANVGER